MRILVYGVAAAAAAAVLALPALAGGEFRAQGHSAAASPAQHHPYFRTRKDGFGYPASPPPAVYLGNGLYVIPR